MLPGIKSGLLIFYSSLLECILARPDPLSTALSVDPEHWFRPHPKNVPFITFNENHNVNEARKGASLLKFA